MCNILILPPQKMLDREKFNNMCYNNWHSYGLVTKIDGKLDIKRVVPESGEINPDEVWDLLERDIEFKRILHVRHNTAGLTDINNCHPIPVLSSSKRDVWFMHNGTMYEFKSKKQTQTATGFKVEDDDDGPSDTLNFVEQILTPMLTTQNYGNGCGDFSNPMFKKIVSKFFPSTMNRGILISGDQDDLLLGDWKKMKADDGTEIYSSNDTYFDRVQRGPEFERREVSRKKFEEAKKKEEEAKRIVPKGSSNYMNSTNTNVVPLKNFQFSTPRQYDLLAPLSKIFEDIEIWERNVACEALACATKDELNEIYEDRDTCTYLMDWVFADYGNLWDEHNALEEKYERQQAYIKKMHKAMKEAGIDLKELSTEETEEAA